MGIMQLKPSENNQTHKVLWGVALLGATLLFVLFFAPSILPYSYVSDEPFTHVEGSDKKTIGTATGTPIASGAPVWKASHVKTPEAVKALYLTAWAAGTPHMRDRVIDIIETTEANAVVIDIKDDTGRISFDVYDPELEEIGSAYILIADLRDFIESLHQKDIYVIGRISVFQDPFLTRIRPDLAVRRESDGEVWKDRKGLSWVDAGAKEVWDYAVAIAKESYNAGFDEVNFDYIRYPSDGNMQDIAYPHSEERVVANPRYGKANVLSEFYEYVNDELEDVGVVTSADLFGMTTTARDDMNIGQMIEYALTHFDYVAPMVYPSHYPIGFYGLGNPNEFPYEIIKYSMDSAVARAVATSTTIPLEGLTPIASTTPQLYAKEAVSKYKLRPWIQDFDYGGVYGVEKVRAQIQAVYDSGLNSWMIWDPSLNYTVGALERLEIAGE